MKSYEVTYIIDGRLEESRQQELIERFQNVAELGGAKDIKLEFIGRRQLAYPIKGSEIGNYVVMRFQGDSKVLSELNRLFKITEGILRHIIIRI